MIRVKILKSMVLIRLKQKLSKVLVTHIRVFLLKKPSLDIYYYVNTEIDWEAQKSFIYDLCKEVYESNVRIKEKFNTVPNDLYGTRNPNFVKLFY